MTNIIRAIPEPNRTVDVVVAGGGPGGIGAAAGPVAVYEPPVFRATPPQEATGSGWEKKHGICLERA